MKVSLITPYMNRLCHARYTIPMNLRYLYYPDLEYVILDYGSSDGLSDFIRENMMEYIDNGRLVYYLLVDRPKYFDVCHAKNIGHRLATGDVLGNLDGDTFLEPGYLHEVVRRFKYSAKKNKGESQVFVRMSSSGMIFYTRTQFLNISGYDEHFRGHGKQDNDVENRLELAGYKKKKIKRHYLKFDHDNEQRVENYPRPKEVPKKAKRWHDKDWFNEYNEILCQKNLDENIVRPNEIFGCATVYKNFDILNPIILE